MLNVKFAIRNKTSQELLNLTIDTEQWEDGLSIQTSTDYELENDGQNGLWQTDSLFDALVVLSEISKQNTEDYPRIYNQAKNLEIVAIHSFANTVQVVTNQDVPQDIHAFITNDDVLRANTTSFYGEFDEYRYNALKAESEQTNNIEQPLKMEYGTVYVLGQILNKENRIPVIEPNLSLIKEACTNCLESLNQL